VAHDTDGAICALEAADAELARIAARARQRTLEEHTADRRAAELEGILEDAANGVMPAPQQARAGAAAVGAN
jgi:Glycosyl transferases group 1